PEMGSIDAGDSEGSSPAGSQTPSDDAD
ncbi:hypothetical protein SAMN05216277_1181, partial [Halolamina pelagica]